MGRPPKKKADRLTRCVMVRLTEKEHKRLSGEAQKAGRPLAQYLMLPWRREGED